jgi:hypothetical protein
MSNRARFLCMIKPIVLVLVFAAAVFTDCNNGIGAQTMKYAAVAAKLLDEESPDASSALCVFDLKKNNGRNGIAVCGKKLYIFSPRGTLLTKSNASVSTGGTSRIRAARLSKNGYFDSLILAGGSIQVFDRIGTFKSSLSGGVFFNHDLDGDGIDELIVNGGAYYTDTDGASWRPLWLNSGIRYMQDVAGFAEAKGFCYNRYLGPISAVDNEGNILFTSKPGPRIRCLTTGCFEKIGKSDSIAVPDEHGTIYVYTRNGGPLMTIEMNIDGKIVDLNEVMTIAAGKLLNENGMDDVVVGGRRGVVACSAQGKVLWSYIKWPGANSASCVYNLFIRDLDGDGTAEVVAGKGNEILIFSNRGRLLDTMKVHGGLDCWQNPNARMDIADINNDGKQEILAVTNKGWFYIFGLSDKKSDRD